MADLEKLSQSVVEGNADAVVRGVKEALAAGVDAERILKQALVPAMDVVGARFETGDMFLPEMLVAALAMKAGVAELKPHLAAAGGASAGSVVIGTVQGDIHDIGKNLVAMMLAGAGFEVTDLGTDVAPEVFVKTVAETKPQIVGLSALISTTVPMITSTIEALSKAGLRAGVKVMIGGAPITQRFADEIGADAYSGDAAGAVTKARQLVEQ